jgi:hypothetical protein
MTNPNGRFQKGQSGNPGGRPRVAKTVQELARRHTILAIKTLADICRKGEREASRVAAAATLLDRGYGRPPQAIDFRMLLDKKLTELTAEELALIEEHLLALNSAQEPETEESPQCH